MLDLEKLDRLKTIFSNNFTSIGDLQNVVQVLKENGASQFETAWILKTELNLPLELIDDSILNSPSWKEEKSLNIKIRNKFFDSEE